MLFGLCLYEHVYVLHPKKHNITFHLDETGKK